MNITFTVCIVAIIGLAICILTGLPWWGFIVAVALILAMSYGIVRLVEYLAQKQLKKDFQKKI